MAKLGIFCRSKILTVICAFFLIFILSVGYIMMSLSVNDMVTNDPTLESFNQLSNKDAFIQHAEDMLRLQKSINLELGELEKKRQELMESVSILDTKHSKFTQQLSELEVEVKQINTDISNMMLKRDETLSDYPPLRLPLPLHAVQKTAVSSAPEKPCTVSACFDYSLCSVMSNFSIYLYPSPTQPESDLFAKWKSAFYESGVVVTSPESACMFVIINETPEQIATFTGLDQWLGDGRNHIVVDLTGRMKTIEGSRAIIATANYDVAVMQKDFDIPLPFIRETSIDLLSLPLLLPVRRSALLIFHGNPPSIPNLSQLEKQFIEGFKGIHSEALTISVTTDCLSVDDGLEWSFCKDYDVADVESTSVFTAIPNTEYMPYSHFILRLYRSLLFGSIPVVIGNYHPLPLYEAVSWSEALVQLPLQRVTETGYIIRNILEPDIFEYKKRGRYVLETCLNSYSAVSSSLLKLLRTRIGLPPTPAVVEEFQLAYSAENPMQTFEAVIELSNEILGPLESPLPSASFQRNFTSSVLTSGPMAATHQLASSLYPHSPWDPVLPSDAKFHGSPYGFRPVNYGVGGSGTEFSRAIGGNNPTEQFTIVILTYNRLDQLLSQIAAFKNLPYLNKVLVVWNNPEPPDPAVKWPEIRVPIQVILAKKNSLNNRFIPYKEIETEAILSLDDDMYLRDFEIILAFRVWRENRDRIVGFPGRYHAWNLQDKHWNYNSNHSCELSMILTGAAFFHKYYSYQYTYHMPQAIRDKVDEYMNCEDLAMNFLVSSITDKPPIKTTSRWTFRCPTCGESSLWLDESHLKERHDCINYFIKVYGYLPLRYTQFRADSVLFKTRVPQDKSKCFVAV